VCGSLVPNDSVMCVFNKKMSIEQLELSITPSLNCPELVDLEWIVGLVKQ